MMDKSDYAEFRDLWNSAHEVQASGKVFGKNAMAMIFESLAEYPLNMVSHAILLHCKKNKYAPTPADIIEIIKDHSGIPQVGPEEAWAIARASMDERMTTVVTEAIVEARSVSQPIFESGDSIGARIAFKETYLRIVKANPCQSWFISPGTDKTTTLPVINNAIRLGRLPVETASKFLPNPNESGPIGKLLTGQSIESKDNETLKQKWAEIKNSLKSKNPEHE